MGSNNHTILSKISNGKYTLNSVEWKLASRESKDLIKQMLTYNPEKRISASSSLEHPWIVKQELIYGQGRYIAIDCFNNLRVSCVSECI